jgi:hypothetical protein
MQPSNARKMAQWEAEVAKIVARLPGATDGPDWAASTSFSKMSNWAIVCEEVLDTQFPRAYHLRAFEELRTRGISDAEIEELRRFAWLTAGWMNFEKMLWDWCGLDEQDVRRAIEWQFRDGWIDQAERQRRLEFVRRYDDKAAA